MDIWLPVVDRMRWLDRRNPHCAHTTEVLRLRSELTTLGFHIVTLLGNDIDEERKLLLELGRILEFPDYYGVNWDAFRDCLCDFQGSGRRIALLWDSADSLARSDLRLFSRALHILEGEAEEKSSSTFQLELFLLGDDESFRNSNNR
jgi:RNAse (barnase) inhibitor barstar